MKKYLGYNDLRGSGHFSGRLTVGIVAAGYQIYAMLLTISSIGVPNAISKLVSERVALRRP